ncbi:MAG: hypothetical protein JWM11_6720 [Planctomycetaceae bacterium]|nr:hypothetical protein [Planctomycetaceae bacterium]
MMSLETNGDGMRTEMIHLRYFLFPAVTDSRARQGNSLIPNRSHGLQM